MTTRAPIFLVLLFLIVGIVYLKTSREPGPTSKPQRWGYALASTFTPASMPYWIKTLTQLDVVAVGAYRVNSTGAIEFPPLSNKYRRLLTRLRLKKYPLISLVSARAGQNLLDKAKLAQRTQQRIIDLIVQLGFDGAHIDFEYLPPSYALKFASFLQGLRTQLQEMKKKLSVAIFPQIDFPARWSGFHDIEKLAPHIDEVVIMLYDMSRPAGKPGPITDKEWVQRNLEFVSSKFPTEKIWLGVPAYGYEWQKGRPRARVITARNRPALQKKYRVTRHRSGCLTYTSNGTVGFFADQKLMEDMQGVAAVRKLAGTALWRLGFEEIAD